MDVFFFAEGHQFSKNRFRIAAPDRIMWVGHQESFDTFRLWSVFVGGPDGLNDVESGGPWERFGGYYVDIDAEFGVGYVASWILSV
jgi:hypothetical protein